MQVTSWLNVRNRVPFLLCAIITMLLGLASRKFGTQLPALVAQHAGDALWAALVFWGLSAFAPNARISTRVAFALLIAFSIETSQLYHAPWIDALRETKLGGLVLGFEFVWIDFLRYTVGVAAAAVLCRIIELIYFRDQSLADASV